MIFTCVKRTNTKIQIHKCANTQIRQMTNDSLCAAAAAPSSALLACCTLHNSSLQLLLWLDLSQSFSTALRKGLSLWQQREGRLKLCLKKVWLDLLYYVTAAPSKADKSSQFGGTYHSLQQQIYELFGNVFVFHTFNRIQNNRDDVLASA